jgi:hypothetical protein
MTDQVGSGSGNLAEGSQNQEQSQVNTSEEMPDWAKKLNAKVDEALGQARAAQSRTDQQAGQLAETQSSFASMAQYLERYPDPAEAERNYNMDQFLASQRQNQPGALDAQQNVTDQASQGNVADDVDPNLLKQYNVDPQSAEFLALRKDGKSGFEAAMQIVSARNVQGAEGAATGASGGAGSGGPPATAQEVLRSQYQEALDNAQKASGGVLRPHQLYAIQEEYANKGLTDTGY